MRFLLVTIYLTSAFFANLCFAQPQVGSLLKCPNVVTVRADFPSVGSFAFDGKASWASYNQRSKNPQCNYSLDSVFVGTTKLKAQYASLEFLENGEMTMQISINMPSGELARVNISHLNSRYQTSVYLNFDRGSSPNKSPKEVMGVNSAIVISDQGDFFRVLLP